MSKVKAAPKPPPKPAPSPIERSLATIAENISQLSAQQNSLFSSTLLEMQAQQKRIFDRLGDLMSSIDDLNKSEQQLASDVSAQNADVSALTDATSKQLVNLQQQIAALKQQQPALDLTTLNASILALEANHKKMIDLVASIAGGTDSPDSTPVEPDPDSAPDPAAAPTSAPPASPADPTSAGENVDLSSIDPHMDAANPSHS